MPLLLSIFSISNGWKAIIGWLVVEVGSYLATGNPVVVQSIEKAVNEPNAANITVAVGQVILAGGLAHQTTKNVKGDK